MSNFKKREVYLDFDKELIEVFLLIIRLNNINKIIMNYEWINRLIFIWIIWWIKR